MSPLPWFVGFLIVTLICLGRAVYTGQRARRKQHLIAVACAVTCLVGTIYFAEQLGKTLDLEAAGMIYPVHLFFAKTGAASYILPVITGVMTIRNPKRRKMHGKVAFLVLCLTVVTAITGIWMVIAAGPLPPA